MSLHDLFNSVINYPITGEDLNTAANVFGLVGVGVTVLLVLTFYGALARDARGRLWRRGSSHR